MPWHIEADNSECDGYAVVKDDDGKVVGCHTNRFDAKKHLAALYASESRYSAAQPRDKDGKWSTGGGSGAATGGPNGKKATKYKAGDKAGSKMKTAPKSVQKGADPDSQYIQSKKTGNVFVNPSYNGNPSGTGKVTMQGKKLGGDSKNLSEFTDDPKFAATGKNPNNWAKMEGGAPKISHQSSAAEPPKGVGSYKTLGKTPADHTSAATKMHEEQKKFTSDVAQDKFTDLDASKLPAGELQAVRSYTGNGYVQINDNLRAGDPPSPKAKKIDQAIAKSRTTQDIIVQRGAYLKGDVVSQLKVGDTFQDKGFLSTSTAHGFGGSVRMRILVPKGNPALSVSRISHHKGEKEVILPRNQKLKIVNMRVNNGVTELDMVAEAA